MKDDEELSINWPPPGSEERLNLHLLLISLLCLVGFVVLHTEYHVFSNVQVLCGYENSDQFPECEGVTNEIGLETNISMNNTSPIRTEEYVWNIT